MKTQTPLLKLCFALFLCFTLASCKDDKPTTIKAKPFPFLKIGNEWTYDITLARVVDNDTTDSENGINTIRVDTMVASKDALYGTEIQTYMMYNDANLQYEDIFARNATEASLTLPSLMATSSGVLYYKVFYFNCYLGQKWYAGSTTGSSYNAEVVSMSEVIETPAGLFDCVKISIIDNSYSPEYFEEYYYINQKYGVIKHEVRHGTIQNYMKTTEILTSKNF